MRLLLLGANGQLGTDIFSLSEKKEGVSVATLGRSHLDVSRVEEVRAVLSEQDFDVLVNCTGYHKIDEVEGNPSLAFTVNAHAVAAMAEACDAKRARLVHISTDYVFGGGDLRRPYLETDCPAPINVYGASKLMGENLTALVHEDVLILRVASLFGRTRPSGKGRNFVETMIHLGQEKGALRVVDDIVMSPTASADVAGLIVKLIDQQAPPGIYHAVNSGWASWYEFARAIISGAGISATVEPIPSTEYPTLAKRPAFSVLDNSKLTLLVGQIPHWSDALNRHLRDMGYMA